MHHVTRPQQCIVLTGVAVMIALVVAARPADSELSATNAVQHEANGELMRRQRPSAARRLDLLRALTAINQKYRTRALHELGTADFDDEEVLAALVKYAQQTDDFHIGPVIPILASKGNRVVPIIMQTVKQDSLPTPGRTALICVLARLGPEAKEAINDLRSLVADPRQTEDDRLRMRVALAAMGWEDKDNQARLLRYLRTRLVAGPDPVGVMTLMGASKWPGQVLLDEMAPCFQGRPSQESAFAAMLLARLGTNAASAAGQVRQCLDKVDRDWCTLRICYGTALARMYAHGTLPQKQAYRDMLKYLGEAGNHTDWAALIMVAHALVDGPLADLTVDCLEDRDPVVIHGAIRMLAELAAPSRIAGDRVLKILKKSEPDSLLRTEAATCLGFVLPFSEIHRLKQAIASEMDSGLVDQLQTALDMVSLGKQPDPQSSDVPLANATDEDWPVIFRALLSTDTDFQAEQAIRRQGTNAVPNLIEALANGDPELRAGAAKGFSSLLRYQTRLSPAQEMACCQALTNALSTPSQTVRRAAADSLVYFAIHHQRPEIVLPALMRGLSDLEIRDRVAKAIGFYRADARPAVPVLAGLLNVSNFAVRKSAAESLGEIGPDAREAVDALLHALNSDSPLRPAVAHALSNIGNRPDDVIPALAKYFGKAADTDSVTSSCCALAIARFGTNSLPYLAPLLASGEAGDRYWASVALSNVRPVTPAALQTLERNMDDPDPAVQKLVRGLVEQLHQEMK